MKVKLSAAVASPATRILMRMTDRELNLSKNLTYKWLSDPVHQPARAACDGNPGAGKTKLVAHGNYENAKSVTRPGGHPGNEHGGKQDVPTIVGALYGR